MDRSAGAYEIGPAPLFTFTSIAISLASAAGRRASTADSITLARLMGRTFILSLPVMMRETSSRSLMMRFCARVLRSIPLLDNAALDAVKQWEFTPTLLNGQPTAIIMSVTVNFTLN